MSKPYGVPDALADFMFDATRGARFRREVACFGWPGDGIVSLTSDGMEGMVEFDFFPIWDRFLISKPSMAFMIHTHPPGCEEMSSIDRNMVHGWRIALSVPILYVVVAGCFATYYLCTGDKKSTVRQRIGGVYFRNDCPEAFYLYAVLRGLSMAPETLSEEGYASVAKILNSSGDLFSEITKRRLEVNP